ISTLISWNLPAKNVYVTGTFNGWKHKIPLNKCNNEFSTVINFPIGIHHIKFIVDDEWKCSNELLTCTDQDGNLVNYIEVDENLLRLDQSSNTQDILSSSPTGEYTNEIPEFNINKPTSDNPLRPPTLPPHLEKVILNASLPDAQINQDESWLLPVPNHVVLNHLYACSIRDGVMAVAGTTRYHKKVSIFFDNKVNNKVLIYSFLVCDNDLL
ncbi:AMPKBI-domain-containing protein, partial [Neoconidiobolus thromboides FSU 785]